MLSRCQKWIWDPIIDKSAIELQVQFEEAEWELDRIEKFKEDLEAEKLKKKGNAWSKDCIPSADSWSSQEDAILCAAVHEYSANWSLASDILYDMPAGGGFRGRFRHPTHCCERYRELFVRYVSSTATEQPNNEKASSGKALLKVTEDHIRMLLDMASEQADNDLYRRH